MRNLGNLGRGLLLGAFALSLSLSACKSSASSSGAGGSSGTGGNTAITSTGGTTGSAGASGTGGGSMGGMTAGQDAGMDAPVNPDSGSGDAGSSAQQHAAHLGIINATPSTPGITVTRPAPSISYDMCKI